MKSWQKSPSRRGEWNEWSCGGLRRRMRCRLSTLLWSVEHGADGIHTSMAWDRHIRGTYCVPLQQQAPAVAAPTIAPSCAFFQARFDSLLLVPLREMLLAAEQQHRSRTCPSTKKQAESNLTSTCQVPSSSYCSSACAGSTHRKRLGPPIFNQPRLPGPARTKIARASLLQLKGTGISFSFPAICSRKAPQAYKDSVTPLVFFFLSFFYFVPSILIFFILLPSSQTRYYHSQRIGPRRVQRNWSRY
ncbi:hypothetical protein ACQKWADRAFT_214912 [Trichoderma austrokoningii]